MTEDADTTAENGGTNATDAEASVDATPDAPEVSASIGGGDDSDAEAEAESNNEPVAQTQTVETDGETEADAETESDSTEDVGDDEASEDSETSEADSEAETEDAGEEFDDVGTSGFTAIAEASVIQDLIDTVTVLVEESKVHLNEDGVTIRAVDPANVGMVESDLDADAFESYTADGGLIGINLNQFEDIIGMADSGDLVTLDLNQETRKLEISFGGLEYMMALIDPDSIRDEPDIPDLDLPAEMVTESDDFSRAIKAADMVSDHVSLGCNPEDEVFYIEAEGDTDDVNVEFGEDDLAGLTAADAHSLFSLDYLKDMGNGMPTNAVVTMELGEEFPVKLHFDFADGDATTVFMLAPRIQSD